ncbi:MAG: Tex-like N-terminal domain-containing protein [Planctomycetota bacterium]
MLLRSPLRVGGFQRPNVALMTAAKLPETIAEQLALEAGAVAGVIEQLEAGHSAPFIVRSCPDATGGMQEPQVVAVRDRLRRARQLDDRKGTVTRLLDGQGKLTDALRQAIDRAESLQRLDDVYLPYKAGVASPAGEAIEQGLGPLADEVLAESPSTSDLDARCAEFVNEDKGVTDAAQALAGAGRVIAERFSYDAELRGRVRSLVRKKGKLVCERAEGVKDKKVEPFKAYLDYREPLSKTPPHRVLAINRGERSGALRVTVEADTEAAVVIAKELLAPPTHIHTELLAGCAEAAVRSLVLPALAEEARHELSERAESHALEVFARNLRNLLLGPRLPGKRVLAIDPGYQNGCHIAVVEPCGAVAATESFSIVGDGAAIASARARLLAVAQEHTPTLIAIGNGKACRPAEELVASLLADELKQADLEYLVVSEAGANVYAGSTVGREELPDLDAGARSAVSIARRVQDPLSELVKVDPASVGVGLYQHDAKGKPMRDELEEVVRSCVAYVGVDLNTAAASRMGYVPGLNPLTARRVVEHRTAHGPFKTKADLKAVAGLSAKAFAEAAGFARVPDADDPLDASWVHPDDYGVADKLLSIVGLDKSSLGAEGTGERLRQAVAERETPALAAELGIGPLRLRSLTNELASPGRDPRDDLAPPVFRRGVVRFEDLKPGVELQGAVLNVVDFGAFVDIGLSDSGLLHISRMSTGFVSDPHALVAVGDRIRVWVDSVDTDRRRVALTLVEPGSEPPRHGSKAPRRRGGSRRPVAASGDGAAGATGAEPSTKTPKRSKTQKDRQQVGGRRPGGRGDRRGGQHEKKRTYESRSKAPPKPITREMEEGKEAMRTFGDLMQFHEKKKEQNKQDETGGDKGEASPDA